MILNNDKNFEKLIKKYFGDEIFSNKYQTICYDLMRIYDSYGEEAVIHFIEDLIKPIGLEKYLEEQEKNLQKRNEITKKGVYTKRFKNEEEYKSRYEELTFYQIDIIILFQYFNGKEIIVIYKIY